MNFFALVRQAADVFGFSISSDGDFTCNLLWNDTLISMDIVSALKPYQKVNHFPTMSEISRKDLLAKNFDKYISANIFFVFIFSFLSIIDYHVFYQMSIILLLEHGYYPMNTIFGIHMLQINRKKIHVLIFLNQIMVRWDMGNSFLFYSNMFFFIKIFV